MKGLRSLFALFSLQALAAFFWTFLTPSETGRGLFLWLSAQRLLLSAVALFIFLGFVLLAVVFSRSSTLSDRFIGRLDRWCIEEGRLGAILIPFFVAATAISTALVLVLRTPLEYPAYKAFAPDTFPLLHSVVNAILPLAALFAVTAVEVCVFLVLHYRRSFASPQTWTWSALGSSAAATFIALLTIFYWIVLAFQLRFFVSLPPWYWKFDPVPFSLRDVWFALGAAVLLALIYWVLIRRSRTLPGLLLVFALGLYLQFGVAIMGNGLTTLKDRYFSTYHKSYVLKASQSQLGIVESIRQYEQVYGSSAFTSTKPPGLMAFYIGLDHLVNGHPSAFSDAARYERLSNVIVIGFPLLAMAMVFLIYAFARRCLQQPPVLVSSVAPWLYVMAPAVALFTFFPDQAIYPFVFLLGVWATVIIVRSRSIPWAVILGILLYVAVFFAFTMLPLYPFAGLYLLMRLYHDRHGGGWRRYAWMALAMAGGTLLLYGAFMLLLNYNFLPRFERTMTINHNFDFYLRVGNQPPGAPEPLGIRLGQIFNAAWFNNLDFAAGIGFPLYILFIIQAVRHVSRFFRHDPGRGDMPLMSLLGSFVVLSLAGTAQGEVPRLWLFWLPMVTLFAALELEPLGRKHPSVLLWLSAAQCVTILLTYHFQDLRM